MYCCITQDSKILNYKGFSYTVLIMQILFQFFLNKLHDPKYNSHNKMS